MAPSQHFGLLLGLAESAVVAILAGYLIVVLWQMFVGKINLKKLLTDKVTGTFSPGRLQLLIVTIAGAAAFLGEVHQQIQNDDLAALPEVPDYLILTVGGSNLVYLGGKSMPALLRQLASMSSR